MRLHTAPVRRSAFLLILAGFVGGILITLGLVGSQRRPITLESAGELSFTSSDVDVTHLHQDHHGHDHLHRHDDENDIVADRRTSSPPLNAVDLNAADRVLHTGVSNSSCTYTWTAVAHRHVSGGLFHPSASAAGCQAACINDIRCVGVDFNSGKECFLIPSGATGSAEHDEHAADEKKPEEETGCVHYDLKRTCGSASDDDTIAQSLYRSIRILCWVMTTPENHMSRAVHVQATWGRRCNVLLFVTEKDDVGALPIMRVDVQTGREHLTMKTMSAFDHVYEHHHNEADWFLKADDDTYVIVENLRYFLSSHDPKEPIFFGHHFKTIVKQGYFSGGAGYVLSKEALTRFAKRPSGTCRDDFGAEDAEMGHCMEKLGVKAGDSRDALGRSRFHCFNPETHIHGGYPDWYLEYDKYGAKKGIESISDYAISFHYVSVEQLYNLEFYVYHLRPYGIVSGLQDLNRKSDAKSYDTRTVTNTIAGINQPAGSAKN